MCVFLPAHQHAVSFFCGLFSDATSWRDGGGRGLAPTLPGEGSVEGGPGGNVVMDGTVGAPPPNPQSHGPPRNPPAGSPALPLGQPPVGPGFPQYRGIVPPFVSISYGGYVFCFCHLVLPLIITTVIHIKYLWVSSIISYCK